MILFFPAIQGSGSTSLVEVLRKLGFMYYNLIGYQEREEFILENMQRPGNHLIYTGFHFDAEEDVPGTFITLNKAVDWMTNRSDRIITSIRDPLKILESDASLPDSRPIKHSVEQLLVYADWYDEFDMFFFPVDINRNFAIPGKTVFDKKLNLLASLVEYLSIEIGDDVLRKLADDWPWLNRLEDRHDASLYTKKSPRPEAIDFLMENREVLMPFLKRIGYRKLSWW